MYLTKKFVCPVCHYRTLNGHLEHWVRSKSGGNVVCPTLLGITCRQCGDSSHTTKKCIETKRDERDRRRKLYKSEMCTLVTHRQLGAGAGACAGAGECKDSAAVLIRKVEELKRITADISIANREENKDNRIVRVIN